MQIVTIESCLEMMTGLTDKPVTPKFIILDQDKQILNNIAKKVWKGTALTDKQYEVVKTILITKYAVQFKNRDIDLQNSVNELRLPIRYLDRSTYIRVEKSDEYKDPIWSGYSPTKVITVRFPFNMTFSKLVLDVKKQFPDLMGRFYSARIKDKYLFPHSERVIHRLIGKFKNKIKDIDPSLLEVYEECEKIKKNSQEYVPGIYNFEIKNCAETVIKKYAGTFGLPSLENLYLYYDRRDRTGLMHFDINDLQKSKSTLSILTQKVVDRHWSTINFDTNKWSLDNMVTTLIELRRFPVLVILPGGNDQDTLEKFAQMHTLFKNVVASTEVSVMNRLKNKDFGKEFNEYIKDNGLNNSLAKNTKIVYIINKKLPKPLLMSDWEPEVVVCCDGTRNYIKVDQYIQQSDLLFQINGQNSFWNQVHFQSETL